MEIQLHDRLSFHQAKQTVSVAIIIGLILSSIQITVDLKNESRQMDVTITEIAGMFLGSAENSAYNMDSNLAKKIVCGFLNYGPICQVVIADDYGKPLSSAVKEIPETGMRKILAYVVKKNKQYTFPLYEEKNFKVGTIYITVNRYLMISNFVKRSWALLIGGMIRNILLAVILTLIFYNSLTRPLLRIVSTLKRVDPENPANGRLDTITGHEKDEMGLLVYTINRLLTNFDESLTHRFAAEQRIIEQDNLVWGIMNSVPDGIMTVNASKTVVNCNPAGMDLFGLGANEINGLSVSSLFDDYDNSLIMKRIDESFNELFVTDKMPFSKEGLNNQLLNRNPVEATVLNAREDKKISVEIRIGILSQQNSRMIVCIMNDIDDRKKAERTLQESEYKYRLLSANLEEEVNRKTLEVNETQRQLMHQEKMASIGHLAAGVAHEINNPMGFITSNLRTLSDYSQDMIKALHEHIGLLEFLETIDPVTIPVQNFGSYIENLKNDIKTLDIVYLIDDVPQLLSESLEGADRINKIVMDLKDFAHPGEENLTCADLVQCIDSTLNMVWNELKYKVNVIRSYSKVPMIQCYPRQLNQVIMNLLVNSAQAIENKGDIEISTRDCGEFVELSIRDTGCGIPEENLQRIFNPFFTTKEIGKGTGLGLNLAYTIINKHNGTIEVKSQVGIGTVFTIRIPVHQNRDILTE